MRSIIVGSNGVLVDSNVLIDIFTKDPTWYEWSSRTIGELAEYSSLIINPIIYAELAVGFERIEDLDDTLSPELFRREQLPWAAGFLAGKCFEQYRRRGGLRRSPLPDFYIGAHAAIRGAAVTTRDPARYRTYFPRLKVISPD